MALVELRRAGVAADDVERDCLRAPVRGVIEGLDLGVADGAGLFAEEDVVGCLRVEWPVEVDEVDAVVGDVMAEDVEVVAVVEDVGFHWDNDSVFAHAFATPQCHSPLGDRERFRYGEDEWKEDDEVEDHTSDDKQPESAADEASRQKKRKGTWGGRRRGAGAPKGNLNGLKHGMRSKQLTALAAYLARNPRIAAIIEAHARRRGLQEERLEKRASRFLGELVLRRLDLDEDETEHLRASPGT